MFTNVIVRRPGRSICEGITTANLGTPDYKSALLQHDQYIEALKQCGVSTTILEAQEEYPDSVFVEDTAICTGKVAIITFPGAPSRQGEEASIEEILEQFYNYIEHITMPGTLDGGDVMMVGDHFYVGISGRTNEAGFRQFKAILESYGYSASKVAMNKFLHLKTGLAYLESNNLLVAGEFISHPEFEKYNRIIVDETEAYAANSIWVNGTVIIPQGYLKTQAAVEASGYKVIEVDVSEYRKLDGGLSCLSLRF